MVSSLRAQRPQVFANPSNHSAASLTPNNGYSSLFTSGLLHSDAPLTPPPPMRTPSYGTPPRHASPIPSITFPVASPYTSRSAPRSPSKTQRPSPSRRLPSSPSKLRAPPTLAADRALTDVMHKLRIYAGGLSPNKKSAPTPSPMKQSRWSSSSEESGPGEDDGEGFWRPRKSGESTRSRVSKAGTMKSKKSAWSLRSRRSEDGERPVLDEERPPMPVWTGQVEVGKKGKKAESGGGLQAPTTPGRGRRVVEGLARRLGLTPKKKNAPPTPSRPTALPNAQHDMLPPPVPVRAPTPASAPSRPTPPTPHTPPTTSTVDDNLPQPHSTDPNLPIPRKTSLSTLRSLAKKTSTGTMRSVKSIYGHSLPSPAHEPLPPTTPRRAVVKKASLGPIGQPKASRPSFSPSLFDSLPRRAPKTPDKAEADDGCGPKETEGGEGMMDVDEIITFSRSKSRLGESDTPRTPVDEMDGDGDRTMSPFYPADTSTPRHIPTSTAHPSVDSPITPVDTHSSPYAASPISPAETMEIDFSGEDIHTSTPISQRNTPHTNAGSSFGPGSGASPVAPIPAWASAAFDTPPRGRATPPLTMRQFMAGPESGAEARGMGEKVGSAEKGREQNKGRSKSRLMNFLPNYRLTTSATPAPEMDMGAAIPTGGTGAAAGGKGTEGLMPRFKKSFSRSKSSASTPALRNGLPAPASATLPSHISSTTATGVTPGHRSQSRAGAYPHLGSSAHLAARPPLGEVPLPSQYTKHNTPSTTSHIVDIGKGYTYRPGAVSRAAAEHSPPPESSSAEVQTYARPATSQGYHHRRPYTPAFDAYPHVPASNGQSGGGGAKRDTFGSNKPKLLPRRRVPDFSRPMSAQDLDTSFSSTASGETIHPVAPNPSLSPPSSPRSPTGMDVDPPLRDSATAGLRGESRSPGHERMNSKDSLMTTESAHTTQTVDTVDTFGTGVSGISGTSGWELERYLRELESEDEDMGGGGQGGVERMGEDWRGGEDGLRGGGEGRRGGEGKDGRGGSTGGGFVARGVIQQAKYGIRI